MTPEEQITMHYNTQLEKHKEGLIDVLCTLFSEDVRALINQKMSKFSITYFVSRRGLKSCLKNNQLNPNEEKLIQHFLKKMDMHEDIDNKSIEELFEFFERISADLDKDFKAYFELSKTAYECSQIVGGLSKEIKTLEDSLKETYKIKAKTSSNHHIIGTYNQNIISNGFNYNSSSVVYTNQNDFIINLSIYPRGLSPDSDLIWALLYHILEDLQEPLVLGTNSFDTSLAKMVTNKIIRYFSVILTHKLHAKNIYIFDNKTLSQNEARYKKIIENPVYQKLKLYFEDLFLEFFINPNYVMENVGKENFREFALWFMYLAPSLDDVLEYDEEDLEYDEDIEVQEIPSEELDIDIMEVIEKMRLESLKHETIQIINFDIKRILAAKQKMEIQKEQDKQANINDSIYYCITRVFKYLERFGNCQIRFPFKGKTCEMIDFQIEEDGNLSIIKYIEEYERKNNQSKLKRQNKVLEYKEEDYPFIMALILYNSLFKEITISTNRRLKVINTNKIDNLYQIIYPMFHLNLADLLLWAKDTDSGRLNILLRQKPSNQKEINTPEIIECKMRTLAQKIVEVSTYWHNIQNARTDEEYQQAIAAWQELENNISL